MHSILVVCLPLVLAELPGSPYCHARFDLRFDSDEPGDKKTLCFSQRDWAEFIEGDGSRCGRAWGHWKPRASLENRHAEIKRLRLEFQVKRFELSHEAKKNHLRKWVDSLADQITRAIERTRERVSRVLKPYDSSGILRRLAINERASRDTEGLYRLLGFVHLVTATGIHLYVLAIGIRRGVFWASGVLGLSPSAALALARVGAFLAWAFAWILSGMRAGMVRPWLVILIRLIGFWLGIRWRPFFPLVAALVMDLSIAVLLACTGSTDAWAVGRWHYALAVGGGLAALELARDEPVVGMAQRIREHIAMAFGSWLPTALLDAAHEGLVALATPLLSLITIPIFCEIVFPMLLIVALSGADAQAWAPDRPLAIPLEALCVFATGLLELAASIAMRFPTLWFFQIHTLALAALLAFGVSLIWQMRLRILRAGVVMIAGLVLLFRFITFFQGRPVQDKPVVKGATQVLQLDVGQGDSALVLLDSNRAGLIDVGSHGAFDAARWVRILSSRGMNHLDWVALTHLDEDHAGGLTVLSTIAPIDCVVTSSAQWATKPGQDLRRILNTRGVRTGDWNSGCFPFFAFNAPKSSKPNGSMSAVVVPLSPSGAYINAGDSDAKDERFLAGNLAHVAGPLGRPLVLKASHHGSRFSSDPQFLSALAPDEVWISAGVGNPHGHPTLEALARIKASGAKVRRTDLEGVLVSPTLATKAVTFRHQ